MKATPTAHLSRRESQIMDIVYELGRATAAEVRARLADAPSYSTVRALLKVLEDKGHLEHEQDGPRYVYRPTVPRDKARRSALSRIVKTFFDDSAAGAVAALIDLEASRMSDEDYERLLEKIESARREGR